jgi:Zn-dependent protease
MEAPELAPPAPQAGREVGPIHPGSGRGDGLLKRIGAALAAIGLFIAKLGAKAKLLLVALPKLKLFSTSASMLVSIVAYQLIFGLAFSVGFVLLLLLHELGHVFQLRREGIKASAPMFIPFLGAVISAKSMGDDAGAEARVGLAGPILGSIATLVPLGIWLATGSHFWQALAFIGFFINLFNLLPILPLDGGRIAASLLPARLSISYSRLEPLGFPILLVLLFTNVLGFILSPMVHRSIQLIETLFQL